MHVLRLLIIFLLIVGSLVILFLLLNANRSQSVGPNDPQPVRLKPLGNTSSSSSSSSSSSFPSSEQVDYESNTNNVQSGKINEPDVPETFIGNNLPVVSDFDNMISTSDCLIPRYAPYASVVRITNHSIEVKITDPNDTKQTPAVAYRVYYWGHKLSPKGKPLTSDLDYGKQTLQKVNTPGHLYVIDGLKSGFSYCADVTALSFCGHGPICTSCFENVIIL